jgi:hypothetical protein
MEDSIEYTTLRTENKHPISGAACRYSCNADVASSGDHGTRWACDLEVPSSKYISSERALINYFWKLSPDDDDTANPPKFL